MHSLKLGHISKLYPRSLSNMVSFHPNSLVYDSGNCGILVEHIDIRALSRAGVRLGYTPDILTDAGEDTFR